MGRLFEGVNSRYGVPVEVYPHSQFPEFCLGWIYILTPSLAEKFGMAASGTPYMNIDDVYVTGLVRSNVENTKVDYLTQGRIQRWVSNVLAEIVEDSCMYQILLSNDIATCNDDMRFRVLLGQLSSSTLPVLFCFVDCRLDCIALGKKSAPIGSLKCNFPPFKKILQTDGLTNQPTDGQDGP